MMMPTVLVQDQTTSGKSIGTLTLDLLEERITVRELIRSRVYQEVEDFNRKMAGGVSDHFRGLVQPTDAEATLNGYRLKKGSLIDWRPQFEKACDAFERNQIVVLVDDRQVIDLEDEIVVAATSTVTFLKLMPLVGG